MHAPQPITPVNGPVNGKIRPPGSKSITNRAMILAALAEGETRLTGVLESVDTRVMIRSLNQLGIAVEHDASQRTCRVQGGGGKIPQEAAELFLENSGTSIRFLTALCCLGEGRYRLDGVERMRERPIGDLVDTLAQLKANISCEDSATNCPPVAIDGSDGAIAGGEASIRANISSQFLSAMLMIGPACRDGLTLAIDGELVSKPYITMTTKMMEAFGGKVVTAADMASFAMNNSGYVGRHYDIEPDASAASYFFGLAAVTGGKIKVEGLHKNALQGDVLFAEALERMGCEVTWASDSITVQGRPLKGIDIDMNAISDTAQTLATVAVFADGPTTIRQVEHMRHKETDRITAVVTELQRAHIQAEEFTDGLTVYPGTPQPADIETYDDHRMAMSFSLLGLRAPGIRILDPGCTSKTYPNYFEDLQSLCR